MTVCFQFQRLYFPKYSFIVIIFIYHIVLYLYFPSGPLWPVLGWTLPLPFIKIMKTVWSQFYCQFKTHIYTLIFITIMETVLISVYKHYHCIIFQHNSGVCKKSLSVFSACFPSLQTKAGFWDCLNKLTSEHQSWYACGTIGGHPETFCFLQSVKTRGHTALWCGNKT